MTDNRLKIIGIEHHPTKNNVTIRVRVFMQDLDGTLYYFDADQLALELCRINVESTGNEVIGIINLGD